MIEKHKETLSFFSWAHNQYRQAMIPVRTKGRHTSWTHTSVHRTISRQVTGTHASVDTLHQTKPNKEYWIRRPLSKKIKEKSLFNEITNHKMLLGIIWSCKAISLVVSLEFYHNHVSTSLISNEGEAQWPHRKNHKSLRMQRFPILSIILLKERFECVDPRLSFRQFPLFHKLLCGGYESFPVM